MSFLGFIGKTLGGFLLGGPAGAVAGAGAYLAGHTGGAGGLSSAALPSATPFRQPFAGSTDVGFGMPRLPQTPFSFGGAMGGQGPSGQGPGDTSLPASHTGVMTAGASSDLPTGAAVVACNIKGHHLNKAHYFTKPHGLAQVIGHWGGAIEHAKGSTCVKNRRMNVGNARALRHALRRARGFEKLAMRTIHLLHPRKGGRFAGFKRARRR